MAESFIPTEFDPLSVENVGVTLAVELLEQPLLPMPPPTPFAGAGVYALYYAGDHPAYSELVGLDGGRFKYPIYIGKASSESAKQGFNPNGGKAKKLYGRIAEHAQSIDAANNLSILDFKFRALVLNDAYINLAESVMIRVFRPVWNGMSLGSKVVGEKRMTGRPSLWDSLHPGRGGRPAGTEGAEKAAALIKKRTAELSADYADPILRRMHQRITKFV